MALIFYIFLFGYKLGIPSILAGEILVFYLPICFFYYLAKLIIFTRSSRIPCIFSLRRFQGHLFKRKKFYPFLYGFRDMNFSRIRPYISWGNP